MRMRASDAEQPQAEGEASGWALWRKAQAADEDDRVVQRDTKEETDFWRAAAREVVQDAADAGELEMSTAEEKEGEQQQQQEEQQEQDEFDVEKERRKWKDAISGIEAVEREATRVSGWDPDRDWKRFDDFGRAAELDQQQAERRDVESDAMREWQRSQDARDDDVDGDETRGSTGKDGGKGRYNAETNAFEDGSVPGFIGNRWKRTGTYGRGEGGGGGGDVDKWADVARELGAEKVPKRDTRAQSGGEGGKTAGNGERAVWDGWRKGAMKWEAEAARPQMRDPRKEVERWRQSARELGAGQTSGSPDDSAWGNWDRVRERWDQHVERVDTQADRQPAAGGVDMWRSAARDMTPPDAPAADEDDRPTQ